MKPTVIKLFVPGAEPPGTLMPKQLQWLRQNIPEFAELEARTIASRDSQPLRGSTAPRRGKAETTNNGETE